MNDVHLFCFVITPFFFFHLKPNCSLIQLIFAKKMESDLQFILIDFNCIILYSHMMSLKCYSNILTFFLSPSQISEKKKKTFPSGLALKRAVPQCPGSRC